VKGLGAIIFLIVFFVAFIATLAAPGIPPGRALYGLLGLPETDYPILGFPTTTLVVAVYNGVVYGVIAWLVFTIVTRLLKRK
jgi:di/tricarboxylate transporter